MEYIIYISIYIHIKSENKVSILYFFLVDLKYNDEATETRPSRGQQLLSVLLRLVSQMSVKT